MPFFGCLQGIQISSFNNINNRSKTDTSQNNINNAQYSTSTFISQDFSRYVGENIGECELFDEFVNNSDINSL